MFDTLYGLDDNYTVRPQMAAGRVIENNSRRWPITLRENLRFQDGEPVLAHDVTASIRRFCSHDGFGRFLIAATDELVAKDDRTIVFQLKKPFPHLSQALGGSTVDMPCIMPERLACTDPFKAVTEMVGSGPYRFLPAEHVAGSRTVYQHFNGYVPSSEGEPSFLASPKRAFFERVEWITMPEPATAAAALQAGEVDWWELPLPDFLPMLARDARLRLSTSPMQTAIGIMRFNHLHPPFKNAAVRRALLGAVDQAAAMQAVAGADATTWHGYVGLFGPDSPLTNDAGIEILTAPRDYAKVRQQLAAVGYLGERVMAIDVADIPIVHALSLVGIDAMRQAGMQVDVQTIDFGTDPPAPGVPIP